MNAMHVSDLLGFKDVMAEAIFTTGSNSVQFDILEYDSRVWLKSAQVEQALGYSKENAVNQLYQRHVEEFSGSMTTVAVLPSEKGLRETRIFTLDGCYLLALLARTPAVKAFRAWVLGLLNRLESLTTPRLPKPTRLSTPSERAHLCTLVDDWTHATGKEHQVLWSQIKAHFRLSRIDSLPIEWLPDALAFVQNKIDALPTARALPVYFPPKADLALQTLESCKAALEQAEEIVKKDTCTLGGFRPGNSLGFDFAGAIEAQIDIAIAGIHTARQSIESALFLKTASDKAGKLLTDTLGKNVKRLVTILLLTGVIGAGDYAFATTEELFDGGKEYLYEKYLEYIKEVYPVEHM